MQPGNGEWFNYKSYSYLSYNDFISSTASIDWLTEVFMWSYERPGVPALDMRIQYAYNWSEYFS